MYDNSIEKAIFTACVAEPRDFTEEEKQYILDSASEGDDCSNFQDNLMFWFESRLSNDCWTNANVAFIKAISTIPIREQTKHNNSATVQRVSLNCQQIATILAALQKPCLNLPTRVLSYLLVSRTFLFDGWAS